MAENVHSAACFCGGVHFTMTGAPKAQGYCHCTSCRTWAAAPVNSFTLWDPAQLTITKGSLNVARFAKTPNSVRTYCTSCGGHVWVEHPAWNVVDVSAALLPTLSFTPAFHVNYGEKVVAMRDGLPKLRDFPKEMGGSGEVLPE